MFEKDMGIKVDDYEYWANAHKDEYIMKYKTIGDKTGSNDGIIISLIAALVNKSTNLP